MSQKMDMLSVILLVSLCSLVQGLSRLDPLVSTKSGLIRGLQSDHGYAKFLGVPYAVVDQNNPFAPSTPHPGFNETFEAYQSTVCPQVDNNIGIGTIDCLSQDIYVPSIADSQHRLPVMVYIHGGGFVSGSSGGNGIPRFLLNKDVIAVAINYRLGAYGFMCLGIPEVPGNQGLKDQVLALRWINENIEAFGGNAREITVFGESAGGMSVNLHLLSLYDSLFQRAIIQSGPALSPWLMVDTDTVIPLKLAEALDFDSEDIKKIVDYFSTVDSHTLVKLAHDLGISRTIGTVNPLTLPCIEVDIDGVEHFMTDHPLNIVSTKVKTTPIIIGNTNNELPFEYELQDAEFFSTYNFDTVNKVFNFDYNLGDPLDAVRHFYIGDEKTSENVKDEITDFGSDFIFSHPTQRMAERFLEIGGKSVYRYIFSYSGGRNLLKIAYNLKSAGAIHADDIGYLFDHDLFKGNDITPADQLTIDSITTLWTNFAKYGDPTPVTSELLPFKWEPVTKTSQPYLNLDSEITLEGRPFQDRMAFWDLFYILYRDQQKWLAGAK
nr:carboxylesterase CarE6 [Agrotis ipsilon]